MTIYDMITIKIQPKYDNLSGCAMMEYWQAKFNSDILCENLIQEGLADFIKKGKQLIAQKTGQMVWDAFVKVYGKLTTFKGTLGQFITKHLPILKTNAAKNTLLIILTGLLAYAGATGVASSLVKSGGSIKLDTLATDLGEIMAAMTESKDPYTK